VNALTDDEAQLIAADDTLRPAGSHEVALAIILILLLSFSSSTEGAEETSNESVPPPFHLPLPCREPRRPALRGADQAA